MAYSLSTGNAEQLLAVNVQTQPYQGCMGQTLCVVQGPAAAIRHTPSRGPEVAASTEGRV